MIDRATYETILSAYLARWSRAGAGDDEAARVRRVRETMDGDGLWHHTASAFVVSADGERVLMTLHAKLGKWIQLGGHVDTEVDLGAVALREALEESGIEGLRLARWNGDAIVPFDVDVHELPATARDPAHRHVDTRYLMVAPVGAVAVRSDESRDLRWFEAAEARRATEEVSMARQFDKWESLRANVKAW